MAPLIVTVLLVCSCNCGTQAPSEPLPVSWDDPGIDATGAAPSYALHLIEGRYTLPETSLPDDFDPESRFAVSMRRDQGFKKGRRFRGPLPFDVGNEGRRFAPPGMVVRLDGEKIPYGTVGTRRWDIQGNSLLVTAPSEPGTVEVAWTGVEQKVARHERDASGLTAAAFVRYQLNLDDHTRDGLMLPAPAVAEWDLTLPADEVRFDAAVALEPAPVLTERSDGASVVLTIVAGGTETVVGRHRLREPSKTFEPWDLDLSGWAGQEVTVRLSTEPGTSSHYDYVFVGSPTVSGPATGDERRVVVIGLDTTRPDKLGFYGYNRGSSPEFDRVASQSVVFDRAWAPAPRTRPSFRSATTGRYPLDAVGAENIGAVFQRHGFATAAWVANVHLQPRFGFHVGFDSWFFDGTARADEQVSRALTWLEAHQNRDSYIFLHFMDPHVFYNAPGAFREMFVDDPDPTLPVKINRWKVYAMQKRGELTERHKRQLAGLYDGEIAFMSQQLGRLFDGLDALGGRTLVVVHSDHGEEFWEHGGYEHNHSLFDEVTRAVLLVRGGRGMGTQRRIDTPVTLADIAPTLFDFAGFTDVPVTDGRSLRPLIEGRDDGDWARPLGVAHIRYGHERWGVVHDNHKYVLHTGSGQEELYDLVGDPREKRDVADSVDLAPYRRALAEAHAMQVGPGWRVRVHTGPDSPPFTFELPQTPAAAGIIDPERTIPNPNNQAWGEPPRRRVEEIGETTLDGQVWTWKPGHRPNNGILYVLWEGEQVDPAELVVRRDGEILPFEADGVGAYVWRVGTEMLRVERGTVCVPPVGEAVRMAALAGEEVQASDLAELEALGYIGGGEDEGEDDSDEPLDEEHHEEEP